jgi:hypothetical protein
MLKIFNPHKQQWKVKQSSQLHLKIIKSNQIISMSWKSNKINAKATTFRPHSVVICSIRFSALTSIPLTNRLRSVSCEAGTQFSLVRIATGYGLGNRGVGVRVLVGSKIFYTPSRPALRSTKPPIQWVPGALFPGVKRPGREADNSTPASAEVKKMSIYKPSWHTA